MTFSLSVLRVLAGACVLLMAGPALAHKGSDAYLDVRGANVSGIAPSAGGLQYTLSVAIKDLDVLLPVDANADGQVTWGEVKAIAPAVLTTLQATAQLDAVARGCSLQWAEAVWKRSKMPVCKVSPANIS